MSLTPEQKEIVWGPGEWVNEPDEEAFEFEGLKCRICRTVSCKKEELEKLISEVCEARKKQPDNPLFKYSPIFGGHLCGYVQIPKAHPWYQKEYDDIDCEIHWGLTYASMEEDGYWIGFDCAHSGDLVPSMKIHEEQMMAMIEYYKKIKESEREFVEKHGENILFHDTYKTWHYVLEEVKNLALQVKASSNDPQPPEK